MLEIMPTLWGVVNYSNGEHFGARTPDSTLDLKTPGFEYSIQAIKSSVITTALLELNIEVERLHGSGHIAAIVNPPAANKYGYRTNDAKALPGFAPASTAVIDSHSRRFVPHTGSGLGSLLSFKRLKPFSRAR